MAIATLIAAGRLDERLLAAALARLPSARLLRWIDHGDAADIECETELAAIRGAYEGWEAVDVIAHHTALGELERLDPGQGRLVELRFFGGLTVEETAEVLGTSPATVKREWAVAKGWLHRALTEGTV